MLLLIARQTVTETISKVFKPKMYSQIKYKQNTLKLQQPDNITLKTYVSSPNI